MLDLRRVAIDEILAKAAKGEGDLWAYAWNTSLDPDAEAPLFTHEGIVGGTNVTRYENPEVDRLFDQARHEMDVQPAAGPVPPHQLAGTARLSPVCN